MTRRAADFARHCRAPLPGGPAAAEPRRLHFPGIRAFESKSALGPGGSPGPGPSTPRPRSRLALSARPWLPILPSGSWRRGGETSVQLFLDSPPSGRELPLRLRRRVQPRRGFYASWGQDWGRGVLLRAEREAAPHPGSPVPVPSPGAGASPQSAAPPIPWLLAKDTPGNWRAFPTGVFSLGLVREEGSDFGVGAYPPGRSQRCP